MLAMGAATLLAGCSSMGAIAIGPAQPSPDLATLDLAGAKFAVDLPDSVGPGAGPRVTYGTMLDAALVQADAESVMAVLRPPREGRSYAVYAFSGSDQEKVRAALASRVTATLMIAPRVCVTSDTRKQDDSVSVIAIIPGQAPVTVAGPESLAALEARTGTQLAACAGRSG